MRENMKVVSRFLLLVFSCQQVIADSISASTKSNEPALTTGYACEGSTLTIECQEGTRIEVVRANYGRFNREVCNDGRSETDSWNLQCMSTRAARVVDDLCTGKQNCWIATTNRMFGDPCSNTPKYLEVKYRCRTVPDKPTTHPPRPTTTSTTTSTTPSTTTKSTTVTTTTASTTSTTEGSTSPTIPSSSSTTTTPRPSTTKSTTRGPTSTTAPPVLFCGSHRARNVTWPTTPINTDASQPCPNNKEGYATRRCRFDASWDAPSMKDCVSTQTLHIRDRVKKGGNREEMVEVVEEVVGVTEEVELYGGDIAELTDIMETLVQQVDTDIIAPGSHSREEEPVQEIVKNVNKGMMKAGSNLLSNQQAESWLDLPQGTQAASATKLVNSMEKSAFQLANSIEDTPQTVVNVEVNIVMSISIVDASAGKVPDVMFPDKELVKPISWSSGDSIKLSGDAIKQCSINGLAKLVFLTYNNLDRFLQPQQDITREVKEKPVVEKPIPGIHHDQDTDQSSKVSDNGHSVKGNTEDAEKDEFYKNPAPFEEEETEKILSAEEEMKKKLKDKVVNSNIISASINGREDRVELVEPVYYTLEHKTTDNVYNPTCSFWDYSTRTMNGEWSSFGCDVFETNVTHTVCACNHLTNFAVLMDVMGTKLTDSHSMALSLITYLGCIISLVCLLVCWITFQFCKNLQCDRNTIHKNLVLCLFLAELIFLAGIQQADKPVLCSFVAGLLHYLFLAAFSWMCLEGVQLYVMLIEVFESERSRRKYYYIAAYGIPAIIVAISCAVNYRGYGTRDYCWLDVESGFIWAFVGPVIAVLVVNVVMLSIAIYMMCKHASIAAELKMQEKSRLEKIRSWLKGAFVLVVLLGLTWTFGLLYLNDHTVLMAYIFTALNSLQGLFIFIFHCLMNEKVQKEYKRWVRKASWLPECIRVSYGGAKSFSSSPHSSSSGANYFQKLWSGRRRKRSSTTTLQRSSTPSSKWQFQNMKVEYSGLSGDSPMANEALLNSGTEPTEDANGYLEPIRIRLDDSWLQNGGVHGDLSVIDASVVDSEALTEYCQNGMALPINIDKYKIKPEQKRLSAISCEKGDFSEYSEYSDGELFRLTEKEKMLSEYEQCPLVPRTESEQNLVNSLSDSTLKLKKRFSSGSSSKDSPSLNDLNKSSETDNSKESLNLSTPNIKFKAGTLKSQNNPPEPGTSTPLKKDSVCQRSMPNLLSDGTPATEDVAIEKLNKALKYDQGLISIYHGKKDLKRLSSDTQLALNAHRMRLTSSDC